MRCSTVILRTMAIGFGLLVLVTAGGAWWYWSLEYGPHFGREPSPNGAYEVVRETRSAFLDSYTKLWISSCGEQDQSKWQLIAPEVDGTYFTDWLSPNWLIVTNWGWPKLEEPYSVSTFRDVRIELRRTPVISGGDSPDGLHSFVVWTHEDSRGRSSAAQLSSTWNNPNSGSIWLCFEGPWVVEGSWIANDHLELKVDAKGAAPAIPPSWHGIEITVIDR